MPPALPSLIAILHAARACDAVLNDAALTQMIALAEQASTEMRRMERALDEIVQDAVEDEKISNQRRAVRRAGRPVFRVVES